MASLDKPGKLLGILLVEDEKPTLDILASVVQKKYPGLELYTAYDGKMALELFMAHLPDIVVTDINMPTMSGTQMAAKIRGLKPETKIIVLTGDTGRLALESSVGGGFAVDHYILKPIRFAALFQALDLCIGEIEDRRGKKPLA